MKTQKLFMFFSSMLFLALLVSFVSAYNVNYPVYSATIEDNLSLTKTVTPVNDLSVIGYRCLDASCSSIDSANPVPGLSVHVTNNILPVVFPSTYYANGYVLYFYKDGYVGWAQYDNAWGSGTSTGVNIYLSKKRNAGAAIFNFLVDTNYGLTSATVDSAIKTTQFATIPLLEKIATTVNFKVNNTQTGQVFNLQSQNFLINYTLNQNVNFSYNFSQLPVGNYTITISTDVSSEAKIINPIANSQSRQILIFSSSNNTNQTNSTLPVINIISPVNGASYTNASILLNATSNQLVNWNYTLNGNFTNLGTSFNISLPLNVTNLINGTNVFAFPLPSKKPIVPTPGKRPLRFVKSIKRKKVITKGKIIGALLFAIDLIKL